MITIHEALNHIANLSLQPLGREYVYLSSASGRVLAESVEAPRDLPGFDNSAMDGYALKLVDAIPGRELTVKGEIPAGSEPGPEIQVGEAMRIFTGAPLPPGAETVVKQEDVSVEGGSISLVGLKQAHSSAHNVRLCGSDVSRGTTILAPGALLSAGEIAVLAAFSRSGIQVYQQPRVAILSVGTELKYPHEHLSSGQIVNSNAPMLAALCHELGATATCFSTVPDDKFEIHKVFEQCSSFDLVLTSGGVSVGDYDLIQPVLEERGWTRSFWKVGLKPGKPVLCGRLREGPVFVGLPGNPASAMATFDLFVRPLLRRLVMHPFPYMRSSLASLKSGFRKRAGRAQLLRGHVEAGEFTFDADQGSGRLGSLIQVESYAVLATDRDQYAAGEKVITFNRQHLGSAEFPDIESV